MTYLRLGTTPHGVLLGLLWPVPLGLCAQTPLSAPRGAPRMAYACAAR
ncbi:MAG: hypothetical protein IPG10_19770 [Flavobacteriales bacterium]|nr:hypothetical protein [Flavobacteriales bacterium]